MPVSSSNSARYFEQRVAARALDQIDFERRAGKSLPVDAGGKHRAQADKAGGGESRGSCEELPPGWVEQIGRHFFLPVAVVVGAQRLRRGSCFLRFAAPAGVHCRYAG